QNSVSNKHVLPPRVIPEDKKSSITYQTVPILKIYDAADAYLVLYQSSQANIARVAFPKEWFKTRDIRAHIRDTSEKIGSFLTVFYKDGVFYRLTVSVSLDRRNDVWGIIDQKDISNFIVDDTYVLQY
ncbi:MAG TPA: hypothetical protein VFC68_02530, partial [Treponemataceae bacterium]|nr:hypothetical protein [Treponemataceae bacterium]